MWQEGGEIGQFYGYEYAGVDENGNMLILNDKDEQIPILRLMPIINVILAMVLPSTSCLGVTT